MNKAKVLATLASAAVVGLIVGVGGGRSAASAVHAQNAAPALQGSLSAEEQQEFARGARYFLDDDFTEAAPILGKFAMRGQPYAQYVVGYMYYFGKGFPLDRTEGVRWMQLAASQGLSGVQTILPAAQNGTLQWMDPKQPAQSYSSTDSPAFASPQTPSSTGGAFESQFSALPQQSSAQDDITSLYNHPTSDAAIGAQSYEPSRSSQYEPSRGATGDSETRGAINVRTGQYMAPAGTSGYVDPRNGTFYASSGPDGVVNTRTGEYSPTSH